MAMSPGDTEIIVRVNGCGRNQVGNRTWQQRSGRVLRDIGTEEGDYTVEVEAEGVTLILGFTVEAVEVVEEDVRVGLFGTVTALVDSTIVLDTGEIIATDENTLFFLADGSAGSLADIFIDDRLDSLVKSLCRPN